jgi:uncharacterized membrane protein
VVFAIFKLSNQNEEVAWLLVALFQIALTAFMPSFVHRIFSSFVVVLALSMSLTIMGWANLMSGFVLFFSAFCWLNEFRYPQHMKKIRAIGYGLTLALILLKGTASFGHNPIGGVLGLHNPAVSPKPLIDELLIVAVALYVVWQLLQRYNQTISGRVAISSLLATLLLCGISLEVQGLTVGMVIILLGFSGANRVLFGLGIVSLLFYISSYYYLLDATLLEKSKTLFIAGIALLVVRWLLLRIFPLNEEAQHV